MIREILFVLIQVAANIIQAITGFAGGPLAMPPSIALVGVNDAKAAITLILWIATMVVTLQNLKNINWKKLGIMLFFMIIGMLGGLWLFDIIPTKVLMIIYGSVVVLIGAKKLFFSSDKKIPVPWNYGALVLAGMMQGLFTSGGPFLVLYAADAMTDKKEFRATVSTIWTVLNIYMIFNMYGAGMYTSYSIGLAMASIIPVFIAIYIGNRINTKINQTSFLKLVYVLLMVSGGLLVLNAL